MFCRSACGGEEASACAAAAAASASVKVAPLVLGSRSRLGGSDKNASLFLMWTPSAFASRFQDNVRRIAVDGILSAHWTRISAVDTGACGFPLCDLAFGFPRRRHEMNMEA